MKWPGRRRAVPDGTAPNVLPPDMVWALIACGDPPAPKTLDELSTLAAFLSLRVLLMADLRAEFGDPKSAILGPLAFASPRH
jgi:hypothetical protein